MNKQIGALNQALDALKHVEDVYCITYEEAMIAIEEALAQPEHPAQMARLGWQYVECPACGSEGARAFPKPEQEPVYVYTCKGCQALFWENDLSCDCTVNGLFDFNRHVLSDDTPPPAQRKPLSVEKMFEAIRPLYNSDKAARLAVNHSKDEYRAIEAAHGIKENT